MEKIYLIELGTKKSCLRFYLVKDNFKQPLYFFKKILNFSCVRNYFPIGFEIKSFEDRTFFVVAFFAQF